MIEMDGTRLSVEAEAAPIPKFEGEDVRRRADFQHHAVFAGAMHRAGGNQEMVVLGGGKRLTNPSASEKARRLLCAMRVARIIA